MKYYQVNHKPKIHVSDVKNTEMRFIMTPSAEFRLKEMHQDGVSKIQVAEIVPTMTLITCNPEGTLVFVTPSNQKFKVLKTM